MGGAGGGMDMIMSESEVISGKDELLGLLLVVVLFTITVVKLFWFVPIWFVAVFELVAIE